VLGGRGARGGAVEAPDELAAWPPRASTKASTATLQNAGLAATKSGVPVPDRIYADGRCPARTGDLLLVRREQLLRSTAVCRSGRSTSDLSPIAAALCCGLSLPRRFQVDAQETARRATRLTWWIAVPLEGPEGTPAALWSLGGRYGGRPVPSEAVMRALADAARADLTQENQRAMLRAHLTRA
jgi:hypothetical protein